MGLDENNEDPQIALELELVIRCRYGGLSVLKLLVSVVEYLANLVLELGGKQKRLYPKLFSFDEEVGQADLLCWLHHFVEAWDLVSILVENMSSLIMALQQRCDVPSVGLLKLELSQECALRLCHLV